MSLPNKLPNVQNMPVLAWMGGTPYPRNIVRHIFFGFTFEVTADIAADAVFKFQAADASVADACVPGAFTDIPAFADCIGATAMGLAQVTIPAGTKKGTFCHATLPCRDGEFVQPVAVSGDTANCIVTMCLSSPMVF